ncbi:MAG: lysine--tRNA ligase, partial [Pseudomonadota bacterium]
MTHTPDNESLPLVDENEQVAQRKAKLTELREKGNAFPNNFRRNCLAETLHKEYSHQDNETLEIRNIRAKLAGRMMTRRIMGKAAFVHIQDMSGKIQVYLKREDLPEEMYESFKTWDIGDIIGVEGSVFKTKTGELSVKATAVRLLTKALRPLPEKFHGLTDQETCYRQRYLDLIMNQETRQTFKARSNVINYIR